MHFTIMFALLPKIFASPSRIRIAKFFLANSDEAHALATIARRTKTPRDAARADIQALVRCRLLKALPRRKAGRLFTLNQSFKEASALGAFLDETTLPSDAFIVKAVRHACAPKLVVRSGSLAGDSSNRIDLLVVADRVREKPLLGAVASIEALLGRELRYLALTTEDFSYRMTVRDRFLRDIFESSHQVALDRLGAT